MRFKNLLVSGCSFTFNNGVEPYSWPHVLGKELGLNVINLSIPGAGNAHISNSIMLALERSELKPEDTLVMAMWSGIGRIDWIADNELSRFSDSYPFTYNYDEFSELVAGGHWWNIKNPSRVQTALIEYSKFQSEKSLTLQSWLAMKNLYNYLKVNGFEYHCTSFMNIFVDGAGSDAVTVNYLKEIDSLKLELDGEVWLPLAADNYLGDYCKKKNLLWEDNYHPNWLGQIEWTKQILIPCLTDEGVI